MEAVKWMSNVSDVLKEIEMTLNALEKVTIKVPVQNEYGETEEVEEIYYVCPKNKRPKLTKEEVDNILQILHPFLNKAVVFSAMSEERINNILKDLYPRILAKLFEFNYNRKKGKVYFEILRLNEKSKILSGEPPVFVERFEAEALSLSDILILHEQLMTLIEGVLTRATGKEADRWKSILQVQYKVEQEEEM